MSSPSKGVGHKRPSRLHSEIMSKRRHLQPSNAKRDSDKDSGFSDSSSGYLSAVENTDSEDGPKTLSQSVGSMPQPAQVAVLGGAFPGLSPVIVMNNVLLKQPNNAVPQNKPWAFQPQVVFLQPVVSNATTQQELLKEKKQRSGNYLPILKSYPKIAPHPGESCTEKSSSSSACEDRAAATKHRHSGEKTQTGWKSTASCSQSSTLSTGSSTQQSQGDASGSSLESGSESVLNSQDELSTVCPAAPPCPSPALKANYPSSALPASDHLDAESKRDSSVSNQWDKKSKSKRFCNTYNILCKSGLLGIALRTKELIRQNRKMQSELDRLKEQTNLFVEAIKSGHPQVWSKLQLSMFESGPPACVTKESNADKTNQNDLALD
ncbi:CLOCK-interacting pacemaker-like isoform X1 [Acipenser oxyrinchus oxyrinchus]|uniref:CLOCK-interacting pacemaker-like isoform X1 n=1 Tax=Acipenser oxyrinchus oxyrinchus TaxID=40147 RepID=A0AAD8CVM8_ACIOX|nr:CLOCK-interacting pacemaker-like isoform X1 [Acipenser oxyrinchus oxyrinchus]